MPIMVIVNIPSGAPLYPITAFGHQELVVITSGGSKRYNLTRQHDENGKGIPADIKEREHFMDYKGECTVTDLPPDFDFEGFVKGNSNGLGMYKKFIDREDPNMTVAPVYVEDDEVEKMVEKFKAIKNRNYNLLRHSCGLFVHSLIVETDNDRLERIFREPLNGIKVAELGWRFAPNFMFKDWGNHAMKDSKNKTNIDNELWNLLYSNKTGQSISQDDIDSEISPANLENREEDNYFNETDIKGKKEKTLLMKASESGDLALINSLLKEGAEIDKQDLCGKTALMFAVKSAKEEMVRVLLDRGLDINKQDKYGKSALSQSVETSRDSISMILIGRGANVNLRDRYGNTALMYAIDKGKTSIVEELINRRADPNIQNELGESALMKLSAMGKHKLADRFIKELGADLELKDNEKRTALMIAAGKGHKEMVSLLLNNKADLNQEDIYGKTALYLALEANNIDVAEMLLEKGADLDAENLKGNTLVMNAVKNIIQNINNKDKLGQSKTVAGKIIQAKCNSLLAACMNPEISKIDEGEIVIDTKSSKISL